MLKLQQYIKNNKQLLIIYFIMLLFLVIQNKAFCDPSLFQKWYFNLENYFLNLTWEKAISDPVEISKSIGWVSVGAFGSLLAFEGIWNARLLGSKVLYNYTPLGHLDDGSGIVKSWFGFRNTAGPLKNIIDNVPYEEILPLHLARNFVFPYIFIQPNKTSINQADIRPTTNTSNNNVEAQIVERIVEREVEKIRNVDHYFEVPVYVNKYVSVVEYKDRDNLQTLDNSTQALTVAVQDLKFSQYSQKTQEELIVEINLLREHENAACFTLNDLSKKYKSFKLCGVTDEQGFSLTPLKLKYLFFSKEESNLVKIYFDELNFVALSKEAFTLKYPQVYLTLNTLTQARHEYSGYRFSRDTIYEQYDSYIYFSYNETRTLFSYNMELDVSKCLIIEKSMQKSKNEYSLLPKIEEVQTLNIEAAESNLDLLVSNLSEKISNEKRLLNVETQVQSTQTANFDLNETIFDRIGSFLNVRDETSFTVAANEGRNLPFNNVPLASYANQEDIRVIPTETLEISIQTETAENYDVSNAITTIVQNPAMMFAATLGILAADNLHTMEAAVQILLGYTTFPAYNDAFIAATHMGIEELQSTYNLTYHAAVKAQDLIGAAYDIAYPETSMSEISSRLSDSNDNIPKTYSWGKYLFVGTSIVILAGTSYLLWQSIKTGLPSEEVTNTMQDLSSNVNTWKAQYLDKINKL